MPPTHECQATVVVIAFVHRRRDNGCASCVLHAQLIHDFCCRVTWCMVSGMSGKGTCVVQARLLQGLSAASGQDAEEVSHLPEEPQAKPNPPNILLDGRCSSAFYSKDLGHIRPVCMTEVQVSCRPHAALLRCAQFALSVRAQGLVSFTCTHHVHTKASAPAVKTPKP